MRIHHRVALGAASLLLVTVAPGQSHARPERVTQVPNGSVRGCLTCHTSTSDFRTRNAFGADVEKTLTMPGPNGLVQWDQVCGLDSDNDMASNGVEMLDPNCSWTTGTPDPGSSADFTNPADPNDAPPMPEPGPEPMPEPGPEPMAEPMPDVMNHDAGGVPDAGPTPDMIGAPEVPAGTDMAVSTDTPAGTDATTKTDSGTTTTTDDSGDGCAAAPSQGMALFGGLMVLGLIGLRRRREAVAV